MRVKHDSSAGESVFTGNRVVPRIFPSLFRDGFFISAAPVKSTFPHAGFRIPEPIEKDTGPDTRAI